MTQRLKINESPHAAKGHAAATACGRIVWRGPLAEIAKAGDYDALHVHPEDADMIRAACRKLRIDTDPMQEATP